MHQTWKLEGCGQYLSLIIYIIILILSEVSLETVISRNEDEIRDQYMNISKYELRSRNDSLSTGKMHELVWSDKIRKVSTFIKTSRIQQSDLFKKSNDEYKLNYDFLKNRRRLDTRSGNIALNPFVTKIPALKTVEGPLIPISKTAKTNNVLQYCCQENHSTLIKKFEGKPLSKRIPEGRSISKREKIYKKSDHIYQKYLHNAVLKRSELRETFFNSHHSTAPPSLEIRTAKSTFTTENMSTQFVQNLKANISPPTANNLQATGKNGGEQSGSCSSANKTGNITRHRHTHSANHKKSGVFPSRVVRDDGIDKDYYYTYDYLDDSQFMTHFINETYSDIFRNKTPLKTDIFIEKKPRRRKKKKNKEVLKQTLVFPLSEEMIKKVKLRQHKMKMKQMQNNRIRHGMESDRCITSEKGDIVCSNSQTSDGVQLSAKEVKMAIPTVSSAVRASPSTSATTRFPYFGPPVTPGNVSPITQSVQNGVFELYNTDVDSVHKSLLLMSLNASSKSERTLQNPSNISMIKLGEKLTAGNSSNDESDEHKDAWPMHVKCEIKGDIILGALMMVHERDEKEICGKIMPQG